MKQFKTINNFNIEKIVISLYQYIRILLLIGGVNKTKYYKISKNNARKISLS